VIPTVAISTAVGASSVSLAISGASGGSLLYLIKMFQILCSNLLTISTFQGLSL
jgi:hypothetical protein